MDPLSVFSGYDALRTEDHTELRCLVESLESCPDIILGELLRCLEADGVEDFVSVVMMLAAVAYAVLVIAFAVVLVIMIVMMFVLVIMIVMMFVLVMVVIIVVIVVVMLMLMVVIVVIVIMVMVMMLVSLCFSQGSRHVSSGERVLDGA